MKDDVSVLPMEVVDGEGNVVERTVVDSVAGGQLEIDDMPIELTLLRSRGGREIRARYVFARVLAEEG